MGEPEGVRAAAEKQRLQEEADRITEEARLADEEQVAAIEKNAKRLDFRNDDGSVQRRK